MFWQPPPTGHFLQLVRPAKPTQGVITLLVLALGSSLLPGHFMEYMTCLH